MVVSKKNKEMNSWNSFKAFTNSSKWESFILILISGLLLYSLSVDFYFKTLDTSLPVSFLIGFQENIYWIIVLMVVAFILLITVGNTNLIRLKSDVFNKKMIILVVLLLIVGGFVRFFDLKTIPLDLDELDFVFWPAKQIRDNGLFSVGADILSLSKNYARIPVDVHPFNGISIYAFLCSLNFNFFTDPLLIVKVTSAVIGCFTVILAFFFIKGLYGYKVGFLSSLLLALSPWHVGQSRTGSSLILIPLLALLVFYTFSKSLEGKNVGFLFLTSVLLGISFYTHPSSLLLFVIIFFLVVFYYKNLICYGVMNIIISVLIILLFFYPYFIINWLSPFLTMKNMSLSLSNYLGNMGSLFQVLFTSKPYAPMRHQISLGPLLTITMAGVLISAFVYYAYKKKITWMHFIWLIIPVLCVPTLTRPMSSGYLLILLPILLTFISKFLYDFTQESFLKIKRVIIKKRTIFIIVILVIGLIISNFVFSLITFFYDAPKLANNHPASLNQQAIEFLFKERIKNDKFIIIEDIAVWTSIPYMWYYFAIRGDDRSLKDIEKHIFKLRADTFRIETLKTAEEEYLKKGFTVYYLVWNASKTTEMLHSEILETSFHKLHKDKEPIKIFSNKNLILSIYEIMPLGKG